MIWLAIAGAYVVVGAWHALRWVDWRAKTFFFRWLPPPTPGTWSWNKTLAQVFLGLLVTIAWPLYRVAWSMSAEERSRRVLEDLKRIADAHRCRVESGVGPVAPDHSRGS